MKKLITSILIAILTMAYADTTSAQVKVNVNINIGDQPEWGPSGYDYAEYYYMPDIETYYYVPRRQFVYLHGNRWIFSPILPPAHAHYDMYSGYKVVFTTPDAYKYYKKHKVYYAKYKNYKNKQGTIKYKKQKGEYKEQKKSKGNGKGHSKGRH